MITIRRIILFSIVWRAWFAFSFSYIHPDEFLQGPQVVAHELFGYAAQEPWEFKTDHPIRSFVPLWLFYGIPFNLLPDHVHPQVALYAIRALMAFTTWVLGDMAIDRLTSGKNHPLVALVFSASSYVTWTYQSHTLSNSFETIFVLWFLVIVHELDHTFRDPIDIHMDCFLLGLIVTVGVFNRPTFLFWIFIPSFTLLRFWWRHPWSLATFITSLSVFVGVCIYMDTLVYGKDEWVICPLNNLRYNSDPNNLALHGTHPWYQHLVINLPQLLGPGLLALRPCWNLPTQAALGGLLMLSLVPHQEARFLLPIVPLLCISMNTSQFPQKVKVFITSLWFFFNLVLGFVMGVLHQGGVVPAQIWLGNNATPATIIWWKTYTPPLWLLNQPSAALQYADAENSTTEILETLNLPQNFTRFVDMMGSSQSALAEVLAGVSEGPIYLVAPFAAKHQSLTDGKDLVWSRTWHSSFELFDFGDLATLKPGLGIWLL